MPIFIAPPIPQQTVVSSTFVAAAAGSVVVPAMPGQTTVVTGVTFTAGIAGAVVQTTWTISDGTWSQAYKLMASNTIPMPPIDLTFAPGLYASAVNTAITVTVPALTNGPPYALAVQGYYMGP